MVILKRQSGYEIAIDPFAVESIEPGCGGEGNNCVIKMRSGATHTIKKPFNDLVQIISLAQEQG